MSFFKWSRVKDTNNTADSTCPFPEGQSPSSLNDGSRGQMAALAKFRDDISGAIVTGGTSTAYTVTSYQVFDSLAHLDGQMIAFTPHATNGAGPVTLNPDGLGNKPLRSSPGVELPSAALIQGTPYVATYNNSDAAWYLQGGLGNPYSIPLGGFLAYAGGTAPNSSFVLPFGQAISRTTYATLFSLVGSTYGSGDGSTTFNIPDLRGRGIFFLDSMGGSPANRITSAGSGINAGSLSASGGAETVTLTASQIPSHTHTGVTSVENQGHVHSGVITAVTQGLGGNLQGGGTISIGGTSGTTAGENANHTHTFTTDSTGGGGSHTNMPPAYILSCIMRVI